MPDARGAELVLRGQQGGVGLDEGLNCRHSRNEALNLRAVERDREAAKAIDAERTLLRDFHRDGLGLAGGDKLCLHISKLEAKGFVLLSEVREDGHWRFLSICSDAVAATIEASHGSPLRSNHEMLQSASPSLSLKNSGGSRKILYITLSLYRHFPLNT